MDASPIVAFKTVFVTVMAAATVLIFPRHAARILRPFGRNGAPVVMRLAAFVPPCGGARILRDGAAERPEPRKPARR